MKEEKRFELFKGSLVAPINWSAESIHNWGRDVSEFVDKVWNRDDCAGVVLGTHTKLMIKKGDKE